MIDIKIIVHRLLCSILICVTCTACVDPFYIYETIKLKKIIADQRIVLIPVSNKNELEFYVLMEPKDAYSIGAPHSGEFSRLLNERVLQDERLKGHKLCLYGYEISKNSSYVYSGIWQVWLVCNKRE